MGRTGKGNKATGWKGTGSATIHYNTSVFRKLLYQYKETGEDIYFDIQITNEDPTSHVGRQTVILKDCNLDGGIIAKMDADAEYLDEEFDFTLRIGRCLRNLPCWKECSRKERRKRWEI